MKNWVKNFFNNTEHEVELNSTTLEQLVEILKNDGWQHKDEFCSPDLQVDLFVKENDELNLLRETYFDLKISGTKEIVENIVNKINGKV